MEHQLSDEVVKHIVKKYKYFLWRIDVLDWRNDEIAVSRRRKWREIGEADWQQLY